MAIVELYFKSGVNLGTRSELGRLEQAAPSYLDRLVKSYLDEADFRKLEPGVYDITPEIVQDKFRYELRVFSDGTGILTSQALKKGAVIRDFSLQEEYKQIIKQITPESRPQMVIYEINRDQSDEAIYWFDSIIVHLEDGLE